MAPKEASDLKAFQRYYKMIPLVKSLPYYIVSLNYDSNSYEYEEA